MHLRHDTVVRPHGPRGRLLSGNLAEFRRDPLGFYTGCARLHGDLVPFRLGPRRFLLVSDPELIRGVLATNNYDYRKIYLLRMNRLLFGADVAPHADAVADALEVALEHHVARMESLLPLPERFSTPASIRLQRAVGRLDRIVYRIIDRRRAGGGHGDLLGMLLAARDEGDGRGMTDQQLRDEVLTLLLAGHETTAVALTWTLYLLSGHPRVGAALAAELDRVLSGRAPTVADLPGLAFTNQVVTESLRLYPPAWAFGREVVRDTELGGHWVPAGTSVVMSQWVLHRDPRHYADPEVFDPDRWADGLARRLPPFAYLPFGGGPRRCIGSGFAMTEAVLLLATITQRFRMTLAPGHPVTPWPTITLRPRHGMRMTLHRR